MRQNEAKQIAIKGQAFASVAYIHGHADESAKNGPDLKVTGFGTGNNFATLFDSTTVNPSAACVVKKFTNYALVRAKENKPTCLLQGKL